ncbi:MAG TPA: DUF2255 family protein [Trebonia sp.]
MTASNGWRVGELSAIDGCGEVGIATRRSEGTLRAARIVWIVRHGNAVYVRSVNGTTAAWYRGVQTCHQGELSAGRLRRGVVFAKAGAHAGEGSELDDALDAAYCGKYGRSSSAVAASPQTSPARRPCASTPPEPLTPDHLNDEKDTTWTRTPAPPR